MRFIFRLRDLGIGLGEIDLSLDSDLEQVRGLITKLIENTLDPKGRRESAGGTPSSESWCFVDSVTAVRFFRLDKAQENLHYVNDILETSGNDGGEQPGIIFILDEVDEISVGHKGSQSDDEGGITGIDKAT